MANSYPVRITLNLLGGLVSQLNMNSWKFTSTFFSRHLRQESDLPPSKATTLRSCH